MTRHIRQTAQACSLQGDKQRFSFVSRNRTAGFIKTIICAASVALFNFVLLSIIGCGAASQSNAPTDKTSNDPASNNSTPTTTTASLSASSYNFGSNLVNNTLTATVVTVTNTGIIALTLQPTVSGDASYSIATGSCGQQVAAGATCNMLLNYTPATASAPQTQNATLNMGFGDVAVGTPQTVAISGTAAALPTGQVTATNNPQVALYTMTLPFPGSVTINFGATASYGLQTWTQSTSVAGPVSIFVAGMKGSTLYHMQAAVQFSNGITATDADHTFTTGGVPANMQMTLTTSTTPGMTPEPGLEVLNTLNGNPTGVAISDLSGNILWTYVNPGNSALNFIDGVKMLPDGDFLMAIGPNSSVPLSGPISGTAINELREVNLAGDIVREISIDDLNVELANTHCAECNVTLQTFHHDVEPLPNGHWLALANAVMMLDSSTTPALNGVSSPTAVLGDVIVDLDQNMQPVWVWNEFNHLDVNRQPYMFPDWTHSNAVIYSKDDGNILVSLRHQNWIVKVNYADGVGNGSILWRLGEGGDFTLVGGTDPTDWQYAQHDPSFVSSNTTGVFSLTAMDNGDDRIFPSGVTCGSSGAPPCLYSTVPIWQIDETAMTATLTFHQIVPANLYNFFGGNAEVLTNGDVEYDLCGISSIGGSYIYEVTQDNSAQTVWSMKVTGTYFYRGFRIPSMYPGIQW